MHRYASNQARVRTPVAQRTFCSRLPGIPSYSLECQKRPLEYRSYFETNIPMACEAVKDGVSYRRAEQEFGVPRSTLHDDISGRVAPGAHSGPCRYLTDREEKELVNFLIGCSRIGYARTRK